MPFGFSPQTVGFIEIMAGGLGLYVAHDGIGRGFTAALFLQCLVAVGVGTIRLDDYGS